MNRRQKRMEDQRAAKDAKMKKVAIGLSVVLVAVLAFEVPKLLHKGSAAASPPAVATTPATGTPTAAPTTAPTTAPATVTPTTTPTGVAAAAVSPTTNTPLPNSDIAPKAGKGQLFAFSHFADKDPFVQQVVDLTQGQPGASSSSTTTAGSSATAASTGTAAKVTYKKQHHSSTRVLSVTTGAARISVNGRVQVVRAGTSFPSANPLFKLVSVGNGVVKIGIASGSYSSGAHTVSLVAGRTLTLVDTADGIRYQLRLLTN